MVTRVDRPPTDGIETLTPRRRQLLELLSRGLSNDEIASALDISPGTVRIHVSAILAHLNVPTRAAAVAELVRFESRTAQVERLLARPAIAVMPLCALDGEPRSRTIAAGLTDDIATLFARWCWFPVLSTASSRHAHAQGQSRAATAQALGARFVVDGSVRTIPNGVRVSLRVDDTDSETILWAEQRDLRADSWVEAQDELCVAVVSAAYPVMVARALIRPANDRGPVGLQAWELAHDGMALRACRNFDSNADAMARFREAIAREPTMVLAHFGLGLAAYDSVLNQWGMKDKALDTLGRCATRCIELAPHAAEGYFLRARHLQSLGDWETAIEPLESAIGKNPSFALAHSTLAQSLIVMGEADEALVRMRHAERLGPRTFQAGLATLHFMRNEYDVALKAAETALISTPQYPFARALAAASAYWSGDVGRGTDHLRLLREASPDFEAAGFSKTFGKTVESVDKLAHALDALDRPGAKAPRRRG